MIKIKPILCFALALAAMSNAVLAQNTNTTEEVANYATRVLAVDRKRDGPTDIKVSLEITNQIHRSGAKLICHHRVLGQPDWLIAFRSVELGTGLSGEGLADLIADSTRIAGNILMREHLSDPVSVIHLEEDSMPEFVTGDIYRSLASQMNRASGKAQPAYDKKLKRMLQTTFDENKNIQLVAKRLNERGFAHTRATHPELIGVRHDLIGKTWPQIGQETSAGLRKGSATVIYYPLSRNKER